MTRPLSSADTLYMVLNVALADDLTSTDALYMTSNVALANDLVSSDTLYLTSNVALADDLKSTDALYMTSNVAMAFELDSRDALYLTSNVRIRPSSDDVLYLVQAVVGLPTPVVLASIVDASTVAFDWQSPGWLGQYAWEGAVDGSGPDKHVALADQLPGVQLMLRVRAFAYDSIAGQNIYSDYGIASITLPVPFTAGSRKPPSQRNIEHAGYRTERAVTSMTPGTGSGRVTNASGAASTRTTIESVAQVTGELGITFRRIGAPVANAPSAPYRVVGAPINVTSVNATLGTIGMTATTVTVAKNGTTFSTVTIPAGQTSSSASALEVLAVGTNVTAVATSVGAGALDLTVQLRIG